MLCALGGGMAGEKILIIEDEPDIASMMDSLLDAQGHHTVIAYDGKTGLDLALNEAPSLILLDMRLPQMNGVKLLSKLQEYKLDVPVVVVTAVGSEKLVIRALRMGVRDYIKKPFDPIKLVRVIERALQEARLRRENARLYQHLQESRNLIAARSIDLKKVVNKLVRLQRITMALSTLALGADLQDVFKRLTEYAAILLEVKGSAVLLYDQARQELICQEPAFGITADFVRNYRMPIKPASPIWDAWQRGQSLVVNDLTGSPLVEELGLGEPAAQNGVCSTMFSVLRLGGRSIGLFQVMDRLDGSVFTADDQRVLEIFASQSAIAIENARLFTREKRRVSEMETLVEFAQAVTEAVTEHPHALVERIAQGACEVSHADCVVIYPFVDGKPDKYDVANVATYGTFHPLELCREVLPNDPVHMVRNRSLLVCEDITRDQPDLLQIPFFKKESIRAFFGVLLEVGGDELGVLYVNYRAFRKFEAHEVTAVRLIAHQAALAIAKSRQFEALNKDLLKTNADWRRKLQETEELQNIGNMINSTLEIEKVFSSILQGAMSITGAPNIIILTIDEESGDVVSHVRREDQTFVTKISSRQAVTVASFAEGQRSIILRDVSEPMPDGIPWLSIYRQLVPDARSYLYVPIVCGSEKKRIGLLGIGSPRSGQFGPDDLRLLEALATQAAIAIQNARHLRTQCIHQEQHLADARIAISPPKIGQSLNIH